MPSELMAPIHGLTLLFGQVFDAIDKQNISAAMSDLK